MGSTGRSRCPLCGRWEYGLYSMDWVGYPTCSVCNFGLDGSGGIAEGDSPSLIRHRQLRSIFCVTNKEASLNPAAQDIADTPALYIVGVFLTPRHP